MSDRIRQHFTEAHQVLTDFLANLANFEAIDRAVQLLVQSFQSEGKVLSCGNGGSMCDAMHFAEELTGRYRDNRPAIGAIAIADPSHLACVGNDYGFDHVFSRYVEGVGRKGDVLLAISTSGNSPNVLLAAEAAKAKGMHVIGLTGKDGGKLAPLCDVEIRAPWSGYADRIQEIHIKVIHALIDGVEQELR